MMKEYRTIEEIAGPLLVVRQVTGATFDELVEIASPTAPFAGARCWK